MEYHSGGSLPLLGRPRYCPGANANGGYLCETGHCCGETGCCTYYYELWWFWLLWTILILFSCCCAYRHRRAKLRVQQQQRQREISLLAYHGASSYPSSMLDLSFLASLKLPSYEEVAAQPSTPPPPYSSVFTTPRYPQPPRTVDPHLLTQHGPLLHRPLSDGPSSLSSDNSSSCSCDSCCPSSPCSSSLSAPVTYETDTSHASTPSEAAPLTLDVTMETITAAASCLEVNESQCTSKRMDTAVAVDIDDVGGVQAPVDLDSLVPNQTVTVVAVVTRAASPLLTPSPGSEVVLPVGAASPTMQQLDLTPCSPIVSTRSSSALPSPSATDTVLPSIQISIEGPAETTTAPKTTSVSDPPTPTEATSDRPKAKLVLEPNDLKRTFGTNNVPSSPNSVLSPDVGRTLALVPDSSGVPTRDPNLSLVPVLAPSNHTQVLGPVSSNLTQGPDPVPTNLSQSPKAVPKTLSPIPDPVLPNFSQTPEPVPSNLTPVPEQQTKTTPQSLAHPKLTPTTDAAPTAPKSVQVRNPELSPGSGLTLVPPSPISDLCQHPGAEAVLVSCLDLDAVPAASDCQAGFSSGSESASCSGAGSRSDGSVLTFPTPAPSSSSCPAITIESESTVPQSPSPPSPSSPSSLPSPPAPALLLDPLTALHQSDKGGSSSGHTSSLSPSPRATQSPPKQTLFSPCVDVFEPGPASWEDGEEEQEEEDNDDDEDDDVGADESQYRHRRLTGDSGIEVCRCRVEEEDDEDEDEEVEEEDKKGGGATDLHDSVDCPARGQITTGEGLTLCNPASTATPTPEDPGEVVIFMETA